MIWPIVIPATRSCATSLDLDLAAALIREQALAAKSGWTIGCFGPAGQYRVELGEPITKVDSVVNHRVINQVHIVAGVSGPGECTPRLCLWR